MQATNSPDQQISTQKLRANTMETATITPVPKVPSPKNPAEYRPISLTSILSRTTERLVIRKFLYPAIEASDDYQDQFAFRPTGGTTAAGVVSARKPLACSVL